MAGRVNDSSGNCCIMGEGVFAVVPSSLLDDERAACFLPHKGLLPSASRVSCHPISDMLSLVSDASDWQESCACHEIEPMLVECLNRSGNAVHVSAFDDRLYIAVMKDNHLALANMFKTNCNEDTLYHVLAAYKAFSLDPLRHTLFVHGGMKSNYLKKFIAKCV